MQLKKIQLNQFRNIKETTLEFTTPVTLFVGQNGKGKTNILEAIHMLTKGYSFRTKEHRQIVEFNENWFRVVGTQGNGEEISFGVQTDPRLKKSIKLNDVAINQKELLGMIPTVLFLPNELDMLSGSPSTRRKFLNSTLIQVDKEYFNLIAEAEKTLKQRNKLLKDIRDGYAQIEQAEFWNEKLVSLTEKIGLKRLTFVEHIAEIIETTYGAIAGEKVEISIEYEPTQGLAEYIQANLNKEILLARTLRGPHREDFEITINGRSFKNFGSRGEHRTIILALKIAELEYLKIKTGKEPILLLDDVMSELDEARRQSLLQNIGHIQTFITTTDAENFKELEHQTIFKIPDALI